MYKIIIIIITLCIDFSLSQDNNDIVNNYYHGVLTPEYIGNNEIYKTPYYIIGDTTKGPKIIIDACMHGDEIAGYFACDSILRNINVTNGSLLLIPKLNILAFNDSNRCYKKNDLRDLNRLFEGNIDRVNSYFECKLADEFFKLVKDFKPALILNLHEDKDYIGNMGNLDTLDVNYGNCIIACPKVENKQNQIIELLSIQDSVNSKISIHDSLYKLYIIVNVNNPGKGYSLDLFEKEGFKSYTIETYRNQDINNVKHLFKEGFTLEDRVNLHILVLLTFMEKYGLEFDYKDRNIPVKFSKSSRVN